MSTCCGTKAYAAPEILLRSAEYSGIQADVFSLGVILFVMVTKALPFVSAVKSDESYSKLIY